MCEVKSENGELNRDKCGSYETESVKRKVEEGFKLLDSHSYEGNVFERALFPQGY